MARPGNEQQFRAMMDDNRETSASVPSPKKTAPTVIEFTFTEPVTVRPPVYSGGSALRNQDGLARGGCGWRAEETGRLREHGLHAGRGFFQARHGKNLPIDGHSGPAGRETGKNMRLYEVALTNRVKIVAADPGSANWMLKTSSITALGKKRGEQQLPADHLKPTPDGGALPAIAPGSVVTLTDKLGADGKLAWDVPAGNWTILRLSMSRASGTYNFKKRRGKRGCAGIRQDERRRDPAPFTRRVAGAISINTSHRRRRRKGLSYFEVDSWEGEEEPLDEGISGGVQKAPGVMISHPTSRSSTEKSSAMARPRTACSGTCRRPRYRRPATSGNHFEKLRDSCHEDGVKLCAESGHGFQANMDAIGSLAEVDYPAGNSGIPAATAGVTTCAIR